MTTRTWLRIAVLALFLGVGVWLISDSAELSIESRSRIEAVEALGPAGMPAFDIVEAEAADNGVWRRGTNTSKGVITAADLRNAPAPDPSKGLELYESGAIDIEKQIDGPLSEMEVRKLQREALRAGVDPSVQSFDAAGTAALGGLINVGVNEGALKFSTTSGLTPPDAEFAVGKSHVVQVVNTSLSIYRKSDGAEVLAPIDLDPVLQDRGCPSSGGPFYFDPVAVYDEESERYIISVMVATSGTDYLCIAVSQTDNPFGGWNTYTFDCAFGSLFCDNHEIGVGYDAIYIGMDMFGSGFGRVFAMDKNAMYAGQNADYVTFDPNSEFNIRPVKMLGYNFGGWPDNENEGHYFAVTRYGGGGIFEVWQFNDPFGSPSFVREAALGTSSHSFPVSIPQQGGSNITSNDDRLVDAKYRDGQIWATHTVGCNPGGGTVNCIKWYNVDVTGNNPTLADSGTFSSAGEHRVFPDMAINSCNQVAVGFTKSSSSMYPSVYVAGRAANTPPGQFIGEIPLYEGSDPHSCYDGSPYRWGDYLDMYVDPVDGKTFWYIGQYAEQQASCNWATRLVSFSTATCAP